MREVRVGDVTLGGDPGSLVLIAGPCVVEDEKTTLATAEGLKEISERLSVPLIFKSSFDKANRTSIDSFRGQGAEEGLKILSRVREVYDLPILTDVHCAREVSGAALVADALQIPALLSRQTDLITAAATTGRVVNIKKGQFMAPHDVACAVYKAEATGNKNVFVTERGSSFGYNNLVVDFRAIPIMRRDGFPVVFDCTHSVQLPSGLGSASGGDRKMAPYLARAAVAAGVDGVFMEVHPDPDNAKCDGPNSIALKDVEGILKGLVAIDAVVRGT